MRSDIGRLPARLCFWRSALMGQRRCLLITLGLLANLAHAETITVAAAADLKFALDEMAVDFRRANPADELHLVYGSSGRFQAQIQQGAPYDLYFSADVDLLRQLAQSGYAASEVRPYAFGRLVLWSTRRDAAERSLNDLADPATGRIAIANPKHAPYGKRAQEALRASGVWETVENRLVYGENVAQAAQFVQTGSAQVGLIALSLALNPELANQGHYRLVPDSLHAPLAQGFIITRRAAGSDLARRFADYLHGRSAHIVMRKHGFVLADETVPQSARTVRQAPYGDR